MADSNINTEEKILKAAKAVFLKKGLDGARMQEIADEAGINKSLLHYYFRTKENLFESVFIDAYQKVIPNIIELMSSELPLFKKIELFAINYMNIFYENPYVPGFLLNEMNHNPGKIIDLVKSQGVDPRIIIRQIADETEKGNIDPIEPYHLIVNMISLCIFPFVSAPILTSVIFEGNRERYASFMKAREQEVPKFIINAIRK